MARSYRPWMCTPRAKPGQSGYWATKFYLTYLYLWICKASAQPDRAPIESAEAYKLASKAIGPMGKCFHCAEAAFLVREGRETGWPTKGWENLRPTR